MQEIKQKIFVIYNSFALPPRRLKFQKTVLDKGCNDYDYSLDIKGFGWFITTVYKSNSNIKEFNTTLELANPEIHNNWKAQKYENDNWEITLII